jgi:hypothetical protein
MMPDKRSKSIVEEAFGPEGPIIDGHQSLGRRKYDQTFWWVRVVKDVGFPIAAAWYIASRIVPALESLERAEQRQTVVLTVLICKVDPQSCPKALGAPP